MPLGHTFVGLAIAVSTQPSMREHSKLPSIGTALVRWVPAAVILAYLRTSSLSSAASKDGATSASRLLSHSVMFAMAMSPLIAAVLMRLARVSFVRTLVTALLSLLIHDGLDLAQATRAPWWPLSDRLVGFDLGLIPTDLLRETAVFGGLLLAFLASGTGPVDGQVRAPWIRRSLGRVILDLSGWAGRSLFPGHVQHASASVQTFAHREARSSLSIAADGGLSP